MKTTQLAAVVATISGSTFAQFPSCAQNCINTSLNGFSGSFNQLCAESTRLNTFNSCLAGGACSQDDRNRVNNFISANCGNSNGQFTPTPSVAGAGSVTTPPNSGWTNAAAQSAFNSYTSAHSSGWNGADYSSFTSQYGPVPTGSWSGWDKPGSGISAGIGSSAGGWGPGGAGAGSWGSSMVGNWGAGTGGPWGAGSGGWSMGQGGPFGGAWGNGAWASSQSWTSGPWTSWWNGDKCPPATWSGWTDGPWSTSAPWTTWSACTARTTTASVYTTVNSAGQSTTGTSFGYQVAQAQQTGGPAAFGNAAPGGRVVANGAAAIAIVGAALIV